MSFDATKVRDDARVLDLDAASLDRRIPDVPASIAGTNTARARLSDLIGIQAGHSRADMLASTKPTTRLDSSFLRASTGIPAPGTLLGAVWPDEPYARLASAFVDKSVLKIVPKLGSLAVAESQASAALNTATARCITLNLRNLGSLEESTRRWRSIYDGALGNAGSKQLGAMQRSLAGQYPGSFIQIKKSLDIHSSGIGTRALQDFLRVYEPPLKAKLNAFNPPRFAEIRKFAFEFAALARWVRDPFVAWRPKLDGAFGWLRREMEQWPRDPYGELVPFWNVRLYRLAQAAYEGDYVAKAMFLDEIEAYSSPDNVLMIEELLKPTFDPERLDRRVDWEQMDPAGARHWLRRRLDGRKLSVWKEEQERKNGERLHEVERQVVEAITSDVPELEFVEFELREDEKALYEQLRSVLPEQQYWFCWYRAQDLTYEEIAARMGVAPGTVKAHAYFLRRNPSFLEVLGR